MADRGDLAAGLGCALARIGLPPPSEIERLSGGANMESWRFAAGPECLVLRRAPSAELMAGRALDHHGEAELIRAVRAANPCIPEILVELEPQDGIGTGYVMRTLPGTADPKAILATPDPGRLLAEVASVLARIHRVDPQVPGLPVMDTAGALAELRDRFVAYGGDRPILALAIAWLEQHLPEPSEPGLVHGDFRLGNLLVDQGRLTGVLDWELAHRGDYHEDLAYACMTVWRFSRPDRPALGLGMIEEWIGAYEGNGGRPIDPARFRFWLIYRTLWWALGCLQMGTFWRSGADRSLERVVVARRAAEQELDLLVLLEEDAPPAERGRALPGAELRSMPTLGEPDAAEILTAVSEWLGSDIKPLVAGRDRFNLAVARNALGIVARGLEQPPEAFDAGLADDLLARRTDLATPGLLARLRRAALDKLAVDSPKYPALALARAQWEGS